MNLQKLIEDARAEYRASGVKLHVPEHVYEPSGLAYMRPSSLGMCALQHAYEKTRMVPDFPELTAEHNPDKAWIMDHGSYVAPMVQEALLYRNASEPNYEFAAEVPFVSDEYHIAGRADGVLTVDGVRYVLEIKDAEGLVHKSVGEPKLSYCYQLLSYMMVMGISHGFIVIVSKWGFNCFELEPIASGFVLFNAWGTPYEPASWYGEDWNTPVMLCFDQVRTEIAKLQTYIDAVERLQKSTTQYNPTPIADPLNDPQGWLCLWKADKGTKTRDGVAKPNCPFAGRCHGLKNQDYPIRKVNGKFEFA